MNSRRNFIRNSGLATSALLTLKPLELLADASAPFFPGNDVNSLVLLHTGNSTPEDFSATALQTAAFCRASGNVILLNSPAIGGRGIAQDQSKKLHLIQEGGYDALLPDAGDISYLSENRTPVPFVLSDTSRADYGFTDRFLIVNKGKIKVGILGAVVREGSFDETVGELNRMAYLLKENRGCHIVVCLSSLGYKNSNNADDMHLAKRSMNIDVIISGNNPELIPSGVVLNDSGGEVLIDNAANRQNSIGKIEIGFGSAGKKNRIAFSTPVLAAMPMSLSLS